MMITQKTLDSNFAQDIHLSLSSTPKLVSSKYLYDKRGSILFKLIMELKEYYVTDSELEVFKSFRSEWLNIFTQDNDEFELVDMGAGDALKTQVLIEYFLEKNARFSYSPIDISKDSLVKLSCELGDKFPTLQVNAINDEYIKGLKNTRSSKRRVVLFLGSNIGNFNDNEIGSFIKDIYNNLNNGDILLIGFDLKKDPFVILNAYNDPKGVTRAFNLNLLKRINNELGGNFSIDNFEHYPLYDPLTGEAKSFLVSLVDQEVEIKAFSQSFSFAAGEVILTEISRKFDVKTINRLATQHGFSLINNFYDSKNYFVDSIWVK